MAPNKRGTQDTAKPPDEQAFCCPLCISELDATETAWAPCTCGYQLCLFCYDRIKSEFNHLCPGCRQPYDDDFQINLVQREEDLPHYIPKLEAEPSDGAATSSTSTFDQAVGLATSPSSSISPGRNLHIDEEQLWPSLSAVAPSSRSSAAATATGTSFSSRHTSPRETPSPTPLATHSTRRGTSQDRIEGHQQRRGDARHLEHLPNEGSTSSSSATTATTPQSPASSVVMYRARTASSVVEMLQGTCQVLLEPNCLAAPSVDQEGANLAVSLQEAVKAGSISVKQAAASLMSYVRQKQLPGATVGDGQRCELFPPPLLVGVGKGLAADAGSSISLANGQAMLASPLLSSSSAVFSGAPSFAQWGHTDSIVSPMSSLVLPGAGLFDGWTSPQSAQQYATQQEGRLQRSSGRLPLYARGPAAAVGGGVAVAQPSAGGSFPGFQPPSPQVPNQLPGKLMSPPGFSRSQQQHWESAQHT